MHLQKLHDKCSGHLLTAFFATLYAALLKTFFAALLKALLKPLLKTLLTALLKALRHPCRNPLIPSPFKYTYTQIAHGIHHPFFVFIQINLIFLLQSFPLVFGTVF